MTLSAEVSARLRVEFGRLAEIACSTSRTAPRAALVVSAA